jgi:hypothetical protein
MKSAERCLSCDVTMHEFHRIGCCEGKRTGQHFVKRDSERIEIASRINGAIHSPGLFERHVSKCSSDELRRFGRLALARKARSDTETHKSDLTCHGIHQNIGRLHILMNQLLSVQPAVARPTARRKNCVIFIGSERNRSRVSPPGSSSTSVVCPRCSDTARGRTAQAESSSSLREYSCSIFFSVASAGCIEAGASRRTDGEPGWFEGSPR